MDISQAFVARYEELPLLTPDPDGLTTSTASHQNVMHLSNRNCARCVGEIAQLIVRDAVRDGSTVALATHQVMTALKQVGFSMQQVLHMMRTK